MKRLLYTLILLATLTIPTLAQSYSLRMKEVDGTPNQPGVRTIIVPNGSLSCSGSVCTLTFSGGGSGTVNSGTAGQLAYYATTGTAVSGNSSITTGGGFTLNLVQPTNGDSDGLAVYANNLTQHSVLGWKGLASTSNAFYISTGAATVTFNDPLTFVGSAGTIMSLDMHDGGGGSVGINYTIAAGTDGQLVVVSGANTRPGLVVNSASSPSVDIVKFQKNGTNVFTINSAGLPSVPQAGAQVVTNTTQSVNSATVTPVTFHATEWDTHSFWSNGSPTHITFATAGKYQIDVQVSWFHPGNSIYVAQARLNGVGTADQFLARDLRVFSGTSFSVGVPQGFSFILNAAANDYIEIEVFQFTGSAVTLEGAAGIQSPACRVWVSALFN